MDEPDLQSAEKRFGSSLDTGKKEPDLFNAERRFGDSNIETARLEEALRNAKPEFLTDGFGIRGRTGDQRRTLDQPRRTDSQLGQVNRYPRRSAFPPEEATVTTTTTSKAVPDIAFILKDASTSSAGVITRKVLVFDGKIKGEFPAGMGFGNYILTLSDPNDSIIYAGATFNPKTLALTSRFLAISTAAAFPESRVESDSAGFLYWQLGFTYLSGDAFKIVSTKVGNIDFELTYGSQNGQPALLPVDSQPGWLDLAFQ